VLAIGARSAVSLRRHTSSLPPNRCAAHPEPFSYVHVDVRRGSVVHSGLAIVGWRGTAERDAGTQRRSE
jgi:hypothetical protein